MPFRVKKIDTPRGASAVPVCWLQCCYFLPCASFSLTVLLSAGRFLAPAALRVVGLRGLRVFSLADFREVVAIKFPSASHGP